jgi:hypothetical protein
MSGNLRKRIDRIERLLAPVHQVPSSLEEITRRLHAGRERGARHTDEDKLAGLEAKQKQGFTLERAQEILRLQEKLRQELEETRQRFRNIRAQIEARERMRRAWRGKR